MELSRTIVLVGLMGAGKSSVGRHLADLVSAPFFDSDDEIEIAAGMPIPEIFAKFGEEEFRRGETAVLTRLLEGVPCILATGGGAFVRPENRRIIQGGVSVWLNVPLNVLWARVQDKPGRPLLDAEDPFQVLSALHSEREPIYKLADIEVRSHSKETHDDVAKNIIQGLIRYDQLEAANKVLKGEENGDA